jgi:hypothetical protein
MSTTYDSLDTASFPDDYGDILMDVLAISPANLLSVKDALNHFRQLPDDQAAELIEHLADRFDDAADPAPYFRGASGTRYTYAEIADRIRREAPQTLGKHIFVQLEAIGLLDELTNGATPYGLPLTFAEAAPPIAKQLMIPGRFNTPGLFRCLQEDYRLGGGARRRAVRNFAAWYGLPPAEADGLLSGAIPIAIDEAAGTVTYTVAAQPESSTN